MDVDATGVDPFNCDGCHSGDLPGFDHFCDVLGVTGVESPHAFAAWLAGKTTWDGDYKKLPEACARCGADPAVGFATIGDDRYCHGGTSPSCYEKASWDSLTDLYPCCGNDPDVDCICRSG